MKNLNFILSIFILSLIIVSCNKDDNFDLNNENVRELDFTNDIIDDGLAAAGNNSVSRPSTLRFSNSSLMDTDNDGINDYAELNIDNLDPNQYDDLLSMDPSTLFTVTTVDGIRKIPLYQTSFYQDKMLDFDISSFRSSDPWTSIQKERVRYYFDAIKKIWLTPEFQDYVKNKFDKTKATHFLDKFKTVKRNVQFRHSRSVRGRSNLWNYISIIPWVISDRHHPHHMPIVMSHELVHHLGFGHNGIPYGTQNKARQMIRDGKADYEVFDINKKTNYIKPCVPGSARNNNNYHSIHYLNIPGTNINLRRHWRGDYEEYSTPVSFNRGSNYKSITHFLNGGRYSIWIDFNDDAVFDASERLLNNVQTSSRWKKAEYNFSIPANANKGVHRLRIVKSTYHSAQACRYIKGQAVDFTNVSIE